MKIKSLLELGSVSVLALSSILAIAIPTVHAAGVTYVWTGAATVPDHKFSTPGNWKVGAAAATVAPGAGDLLDFPYGTGVTDKAPVNDEAAGTSFASITFDGTLPTSESPYIVSGNAVQLTGGISATVQAGTISLPIAFTADQSIVAATGDYLSLSGVLSGTGNLTLSGTGVVGFDAANTFTGNVTVTAGVLSVPTATSLGTTAGGTTVATGASLNIGDCGTGFTLAENLNLSGLSASPSASYDNGKLNLGTFCVGGRGGDQSYGTFANSGQEYILSGAIVLASDITYDSVAKTVTLTGALSGNYKFNSVNKYDGSLVVNGSTNTTATANGTYASQPVVITLSDNAPSTTVDILNNATVTIDGTRSDVAVSSGGILKGTGTLGALFEAKGGVVAPGHSPGCLTSGDLSLAGTYQAEIGGTDPCTGYDQLKVTGAVDITGSTLDATLYGGFVPKVGQSYIIISNDAADAVTGTFTGIAEGGTYTNQGVTYSVTYKGGDGNDVVLTVKSVDSAAVPKKPDTGFALVAAHPIVSFLGSTIAALSLIVLARRLNLNTK